MSTHLLPSTDFSSLGTPSADFSGVTSSPMPVGGVQPLNERELVILAVLQQRRGRVITRTELARRAGLRDVSPRRIDALLVNVRRVVGVDRLVNVRSRGWMLSGDSHPEQTV